MEKEFTQTQHRSVRTDVSPVISVKHFNLWYTDFQALKDISLDIPEHRATAFIGPSGCGKSTLLRTFNRMCDFVEGVQTEGVVEFEGPGHLQDRRQRSARARWHGVPAS